MRPIKRSGVNKSASARQFRRQTQYTKGANINTAPMRGGIRL